MTIDHLVIALTLIVTLLGFILAATHSQYWALVSVMSMANIFRAAYSGYCPAGEFFKRFGMRSGHFFS